MKYGFQLDWDELPLELQEEKINNYIQHHINKYRELVRHEDFNDDKDVKIADHDVILHYSVMQDAASKIEAHFPVYC